MNIGYENQPLYTQPTSITVTIGTAVVQLPNFPAGIVDVRADPNNSGDIWVGDATVTNDSGANPGYYLAPGDMLPKAALDNLNRLYAIASGSGQLLRGFVQR